jgi:hypothetical protein
MVTRRSADWLISNEFTTFLPTWLQPDFYEERAGMTPLTR